ncbi:Clp protease N-terminal domain-containing protein [Streptomyces sp. ODS28]|uniref:Clp protease N-terminal domain-containing protein n=1 Tax=Streptomyces sp. ODS28 TaxID=3136688 RepID=UPI0031E7864F
MFERFTGQARQLVIGAQEEARALGHDRIGTEHLLLGALLWPEQPGAATLIRLGASAEDCRAAMASLSGPRGDALDEEDAEALKALGIDLAEVRRRADDAFGSGALDAAAPEAGRKQRGLFGLGRRRGADDGRPSGKPNGRPKGHIPFTARAKKALELSLREAVARNDRTIGVEHIVLALLRGEDATTRELLERLGLAPREAREAVLADLRKAA